MGFGQLHARYAGYIAMRLVAHPDPLILCTWPGNFRSDSGAFWQSAAPRMAGNTYRLRAKAAREAGYRLGSERGSPNHGSTLASKRVMAQIWPPARVST